MEPSSYTWSEEGPMFVCHLGSDPIEGRLIGWVMQEGTSWKCRHADRAGWITGYPSMGSARGALVEIDLRSHAIA